MIGKEELRNHFDAAGFANTHEIKRTSEFKSRSNARYIYVDKDRLPNRVFVYIEDTLPNFKIPGTEALGRRFRSNMRHFPSRINNGKTPCHYGLAVKIDNSACLLDFLQWFNSI